MPVFDMPWHYDVSKQKVIPNPKLKTRSKMLIWHMMKFSLSTSFLLCVYCCVRVVRQFSETGSCIPEELCINFTALAMVTQACVTIYTLEKDPKEICYVNSEIFRRGGVKFKGWPSSKRLPNLQELVAYSMAVAFFFFPFGCAMYPLIRSYDPLNVELKDILPNVPRRVTVAFLYGILSFYGAITCCSFLLSVVTVVDAVQREAEANYKLSVGMSINETPRLLERIIQGILKRVFLLLERIFRKNTIAVQLDSVQPDSPYMSEISVIKPKTDTQINRLALQLSLSERFKIRRKRHIKMRLLMETSNRTVDIFVPTMVIVGMLICVMFNYTIISMYDREDFRLFIAIGSCLLLCINTLIIFLCKHASLPLVLTSKTIMFWKGRLTGSVAKRQVRCMRPLGFTMGRFFYAKRDTALEINDVILNVTISLLLGEI
ncbi:unnamed protein product [Orchesella dallaii]|uniref:Odorant receptor n=1 Tax=Orchesella dallaii TaxID=48710 RepID=A0ABP1QYW4_9HEXA